VRERRGIHRIAADGNGHFADPEDVEHVELTGGEDEGLGVADRRERQGERIRRLLAHLLDAPGRRQHRLRREVRAGVWFKRAFHESCQVISKQPRRQREVEQNRKHVRQRQRDRPGGNLRVEFKRVEEGRDAQTQ